MLLDTGTLFAAVFEAHANHVRVMKWLEGVPGFSTCGLTQIGAFRLLLTDAAMNGAPLAPSDAHRVIGHVTALPRHRLLPCPQIGSEFVGQTSGSSAAFDDYLVQIAVNGSTKLATLDTRLATRWRAHAHVIR